MKLKLFLIFIFLSVKCYSQTAQWEWARACSSNLNESVYSSQITKDGYIYIVGQYSGPALDLGTTTLVNPYWFSSVLNSRVFYAKYNFNGDLIWAKQVGGNNYSIAFGIAVNDSGMAYITGYYNSSNLTFGSVSISNTPTWGYFLAKVDSSGDGIWVRKEGDNLHNADRGECICCDRDGNVIVAGRLSAPSVIFGTTTLINTNGDYPIFLSKYDPSGNILWAKSCYSPGAIYLENMIADENGNFYLSGAYTNSLRFNGASTPVGIQSNGIWDGYLFKFGSNGIAFWGKTFGGTDYESDGGLALGNNGSVYKAGIFQSSVIDIDSYHFTRNGSADSYLAKCDGNGTVIWAKQIQGNIGKKIGNRDLASDENENLYLSGYYTDSIVQFGSINFHGHDSTNLYIASCDSAGNFLWASGTNSPGEFSSWTLHADTNSVFITGTWRNAPAAYFNNDTLNLAGGEDVFIAKTGHPIVSGINNHYAENSISVYPNPARNEIYFNSTTALNVKIYNSSAMIVLSERCFGKTDISTLSSGIYMVIISDDKGKILSRLKLMKN